MNLSTNDILNKLHVIHTRSLPMYLSYAPPWQVRNHPRFRETLENIVHLQQDMADRLATLILENGGQVDYGEFPMHFTGLHDLSVEYLLKQCIEREKKGIAIIEKCVSLLALAPYAQAVAQEALGEAKGHLEALEAAAQADPLEQSAS
jgi:hypothetical protein